MKRTASLAGALLLLALPLVCHPQQRALKPGEYVTEKGWGHLSLQRSRNGQLNFSLTAVGANAHTCDLDGEIGSRGQTVLVDDSGATDGACVIDFRARGRDVEVRHNNAPSCASHCGARARFEGLYLRPSPSCHPARRDKTRAAFKRLYDAGEYARAAALLQPVIEQCAPLLSWTEAGWLRNDLALAKYRKGDRAGCQAMLAPLAGDAGKTDTELREQWAAEPMLEDTYFGVVRATRTNLGLCQAEGRPAPP
ncbi:hypothetical protein [Caldimonas brevitalea]|uniref:Secreted protein n=1 Tax=Caldimonas brevitalea TaxID=413882 RepID=A0A0G3BJM5_9BURK|nr:hypothetical protein [Caldimonas brevitalea]AKJ29659.1 hypothetical protein AAW51_2968 [Caldimonas brevitalea]